MKASDLREKSPEDLRELGKTLASDVFQNRLKNFTNRLDDTSAIRKTRRDLARVATLLRELTLEKTGLAKGEVTPGAASAAASPAAPAAKAAPEPQPTAPKKASKAKAAVAKEAAAGPSEPQRPDGKKKSAPKAKKSEAK